MAIVIIAITGMLTTATTVSRGEMVSIITITPRTVRALLSIWVMVCCSDWATLSTSLVARDRMSPRDSVSK